MSNNVSGISWLIKEMAVENRNKQCAAQWEFKDILHEDVNSLSYRTINRRIRQIRNNLDKASLMQEKRDKRTGRAALLDSGNNIRVDTEALLSSVNFNKGSIEDFVSMGLSGCMNKAEANLVAIELGRLINSAVYMHGLTIEERAVNSEIGRRLAEYFALTYFEDQEEAKALMLLVNSFIERNVMLEKGYYFWDGQAYESYKPVPISIVYILGKVHWSKETAEAFRCNERIVEETISHAIASVDDDAVSTKLALIMAKLGMISDIVDEDNLVRDIQWVLDLQHLFIA